MRTACLTLLLAALVACGDDATSGPVDGGQAIDGGGSPSAAQARCKEVHQRYLDVLASCGVTGGDAEARYLAVEGNPASCDAVQTLRSDADADQCLTWLLQLEQACPEIVRPMFRPTASCVDLFQ